VFRRLFGAVVLAVSGIVFVSTAVADTTTTTVASAASRTLTLFLPGQFSGCDFFDANLSMASRAILDLVLPSAFSTQPNGQQVGEGTAISSAELTSLSPETVVYNLNPHSKWSDGVPFSADDLYAWWARAKALRNSMSDGYQDISTMNVSNQGQTVTAVFSHPYSDWNLLFRDIEPYRASTSCSVNNWSTRPSLGPYKIQFADSHLIVLKADKNQIQPIGRFGTILVHATGTSGASPLGTNVVTYQTAVTKGAVQLLSGHPSIQSRLGATSLMTQLAFAPKTNITFSQNIRQFLSESIDPQQMINQLWGNISFFTSISSSALYSQTEFGNNGVTIGSTPVTTTIPNANSLPSFCVACALESLKKSGYKLRGGIWVRNGVALPPVVIAYGPSATDKVVASDITQTWSKLHVRVYQEFSGSMIEASELAANNQVDVAIFDRDSGLKPSQTARSFYGSIQSFAFDRKVRNSEVTSFYEKAIANFNPISSAFYWNQIDKWIVCHFWIRPLFSPPYLLTWDEQIGGVSGATSMVGFVDEIPQWTWSPSSSNG
jgi:peptide/nickel transport system substrate-binding protein